MTDDAAYLQELYRHNGELLAHIAAFNLSPERSVHSDWLERVDPGGVVRQRCRNNRRYPLAGLLTSALELDDGGFWSFREEGKRLLLLPGTVLRGLIVWCGLSLHWQSVARCIDGRAVTELKREYGEAQYRFVIRSAGLLAGALAEPFRTLRPGQVTTEVESAGARVLADSLGTLPPGALKRLQLKFPAGGGLALPGWDEARTTASFSLCRRLLFHNTGNQWAFLFR